MVRLGDGDDVGRLVEADGLAPIELYGEAGNDIVTTPRGDQSAPGSLLDGGDGDDRLVGGAEVQRGGGGADHVEGGRYLAGGEGDDVLRKAAERPGGIDAGPGDDRLFANDGRPDTLVCGPGADVLAEVDESDRPDGSCEQAPEAPGPAPRPAVTVFELPGGRSRPGRDGRLAVWMRCSVANCAVNVQIRAAGELPSRLTRFAPRHAPVRRLVVGTTARRVRIPLTRIQRRALRRAQPSDSVVASVTARTSAGRTQLKTDGLYCTRRSPCAPRGR